MLRLLFTLVLVAAIALAGAAAFLVLNSEDDLDGVGGIPPLTPENPDGGPTGHEVLNAAAERAATITSFHFVLSHENGTTPLPLNLALRSAEGDVVVPDGLQAEVDARAAGVNVRVQIIGIDGRTWVTNPFTRAWQSLPGTDIRDFANPSALVAAVLPEIRDATLDGTASLRGDDMYFVTGTIDSGALRSALGFAEPGYDVTVETWISTEDHLPRRIRLIGPLSAAESPDVVRDIELSHFNQPLEIMPPE